MSRFCEDLKSHKVENELRRYAKDIEKLNHVSFPSNDKKRVGKTSKQSIVFNFAKKNSRTSTINQIKTNNLIFSLDFKLP